MCVGEGVECKPTVKRNKMYFWTRIKFKVAATNWIFEDMLILATCRLVGFSGFVRTDFNRLMLSPSS